MLRGDDNHHLWRNGRLWWVAFVALADGVRQVRIRQSLKTDDVEIARARRDALIEEYEQRAGWVVPRRIQSRRNAQRSRADVNVGPYESRVDPHAERVGADL
jgi:hypothetical protein